MLLLCTKGGCLGHQSWDTKHASCMRTIWNVQMNNKSPSVVSTNMLSNSKFTCEDNIRI
jgi:hypothetical protein